MTVPLLSSETNRAERQEQDPVPDPGLGPRLPQRAQVQSGPRHLPDHEGGRYESTVCSDIRAFNKSIKAARLI